MLNKLSISAFALGTLASSIAMASPLEGISPVQQIQNELLIVSEKEAASGHSIRVAGDEEQNRRIEFIFG